MPRDLVTRGSRPLICVLGMRGIPGVMGGVESHCQELLPRLASAAPHLRLVALGRRPYIGRKPIQFHGVRVVPLPAPTKQSVETLVSTFLGVLYARFVGARAVHIHAVASGLAAPLAKILGMKVILTVHGADYQRAKWGPMARFLLRSGERIGVRNADAVICVAPSLTRSLKDRYPASAARIEYVPNGAPPPDTEGDESALLQKFGLEPRSFVLAVGRIEPGKGFETLIDAFRRSGSKKKLIIVGGAHHEGKYASKLMQCADEQVIFAGVQPRHVLFHLYRNAALFVLPSLHEGLPICALEAASAGCPILLSDIPGNRDLGLPDTHYFKPGDVIGLSSALQAPDTRFAISPDMFSAFDWGRISTETLRIYDAVVGRR